ncbi:MAG: SMP-30/gluconolactonase/LRE family protein [Actinomycetes bacterium]
MKVEIFDERVCIIGEGPSSFGLDHSEFSWVDIIGSRVLTRNLVDGTSGEFATEEHVGFAVRRRNGGYVLGTNSGPILRDPDGSSTLLFSLLDADPQTKSHAIRWNDAKVSPDGNLFLGTMGYEKLRGTSTLFAIAPRDKHPKVILAELTISNGMDWSDDGQTCYFIDSQWQAIRSFSVVDEKLVNPRNVIEVPAEEGAPDGMCLDAEGGIWVALWGGSEIRRYDANNGFVLTERIPVPAPFVTSMAFGGADLKTLIITSATDGLSNLSPESGMTFFVQPGVQGRPSSTFAG